MAALFHSSAAHASRTKQRNSFLSQGLPHIRISGCNKTVSETRANLEDKISRSISSAKVSSYESLLCLLEELTVKNCLLFHVPPQVPPLEMQKYNSEIFFFKRMDYLLL